MAVTGEFVKAAAQVKPFDQKLALAYYLLAIITLSFYGTRVCPFVESLNPLVVLATFGVAFASVLALKLLLEEKLMRPDDPFGRSVLQFLIDLALFTVAGIAIALYNHFWFGFPLESGFKVLIGCFAFGIFAGLDNGLRRERRTPPPPASAGVEQRIFPITRRLVVIFFGIAIFTGLVTALVLIKDIDFIIDNVDRESHAFLRRAVFIDIGFILLTVLALSLRLMWSYGNNLRYMLSLQIAGLSDVSRGRLDTVVPVVTRDEFSLIARKTNQMIGTLKRASEEQAELFRVSLALATELQLGQLLTMIVATTRSFVGADRVSLFLHDARTDELWSKVAEGEAQELRFPADEGIAGQVFRSGQSLTVDDPYEHPKFNRRFDEVTGYVTRNILCVPITSRAGDTIGVIQAINKLDGRFTRDDASRLRAFAAQASVALVNAQLFADLNRMKNYNESILRSLTNGVITLDGDGVVVKVNEAAQRLLATSDELLGQSLDAVLSAENQWLEAIVAGGAELYLPDQEIVLDDGKRHSVNLARVPLADLEDHTIGSMLVLEDLSEEKRVRATLSRYVPHTVADRLLSDHGASLGGTQQKVTVLFSDIRGFTSMSERIGARQTVAMLNEYFAEMAEAISEQGGVIDKYIGDAVMAAFGVPFPGPTDADGSVKAALDMLHRLEALNQRRVDRGHHAIDIGIGLNTGEVVVGNIGSARRMDYTVIGDTVNLAARIESASKQYRARLMISELTLGALTGSYPIRQIDRVAVRGKDQPVGLYQVLDSPALAEERHLRRFDRALSWYLEGEFQLAVTGFSQLSEQDPTAEMLASRCESLVVRPPQGGWPGHWVMG
ncbi:MAG: adenylate/guanylate cyclase domain-containing protein [Pseudomonadota bacterium]